MSENLKYKLNGRIATSLEVIKEVHDHAENYKNPETRKAFLKVVGAELKINYMKEKIQTIYLPIFGVLLLMVCLYIAFATPYPTRFQTGVFWVALCLAAAASAALIPGFLDIKYQGVIRAGGALGVFIVMYLLNPKMTDTVETPKTEQIVLFLAHRDTLHYQKLSPDFDVNSSSILTQYCCQSLSDYYGFAFKAQDFTFYRKVDGRIYNEEKCRDVKEREVIIIADSIIRKFKDKREAFEHFAKLQTRE